MELNLLPEIGIRQYRDSLVFSPFLAIATKQLLTHVGSDLYKGQRGSTAGTSIDDGANKNGGLYRSVVLN
jgi:hypothetical protein